MLLHTKSAGNTELTKDLNLHLMPNETYELVVLRSTKDIEWLIDKKSRGLISGGPNGQFEGTESIYIRTDNSGIGKNQYIHAKYLKLFALETN